MFTGRFRFIFSGPLYRYHRYPKRVIGKLRGYPNRVLGLIVAIIDGIEPSMQQDVPNVNPRRRPCRRHLYRLGSPTRVGCAHRPRFSHDADSRTWLRACRLGAIAPNRSVTVNSSKYSPAISTKNSAPGLALSSGGPPLRPNWVSKALRSTDVDPVGLWIIVHS